MARRILNRRELRAASEAAERRGGEEEDVHDETEEEEDSDEEAEAEVEAEEGESEGEDEDEEAPKKRKKKAAKPAAEPKRARPRKARTPKITRLKLVWGVFNNSNQRIASYDYARRAEAEAHAAKLTADKKNTHFVQPVKEPFEEKKEA